MKLPTISQYVHKKVDKDNWQNALKRFSTDQKQQLEHFLAQCEQGIDVSLSEEAPPSHSKSSPKMSMTEKCKMAQTILKWHDKRYLMGPFPQNHPIKNECRINPVFCVPKPDGSVRPVVNYSKKINGASLNDLLNPD